MPDRNDSAPASPRRGLFSFARRKPKPRKVCDNCDECVDSCPSHIDIPKVLGALELEASGDTQAAAEAYRSAVVGGGRASDCMACGMCEYTCHLEIPVVKSMQKAVASFE